MSTQFSNYLGDWICNDSKDPERCEVMKCVRVDDKTRMAIFESGKQISLFDLDNSDGLYEKMHSIYNAPEVAEQLGQMKGSLASRAPQSEILGDLSKIGNRSKQAVNENLRMTDEELERKVTAQHETEEFQDPQPQPQSQHQRKPRNFDNPVASFISSAIQLSRKAGATSEIPVKINLKLDFDILSVIKSAMSLGATDVEILQHIFDEIEISQSQVKHAIFEELLKSPDDVDIAMSEREKEFDNVLSEELGNHSNHSDNDNPTYTELK